MLSRRNVRVKIMQVLYAMGRDSELQLDQALHSYRQRIAQSYELYLFTLRYVLTISQYARQDEVKKKAKLRPTEQDKSFTARLADHPIMESIHTNEGLLRLFRLHQLEKKLDEDTVRLVYSEFAQKEEYKTYASKKVVSDEEQIQMLLDLFKSCINNESFTEALEDHYPNWLDDKSLVIGVIKKNIKALPVESYFHEEYRPSKEATSEFGEALVEKVCSQDEALLAIIEPTLNNWDVERVAIIDMILIKMAVVEFMDFASIPTKVTLNEFVEISKSYSTDKSKDFINGILDRLLKKLTKEGKIVKKGRGLIE